MKEPMNARYGPTTGCYNTSFLFLLLDHIHLNLHLHLHLVLINILIPLPHGQGQNNDIQGVMVVLGLPAKHLKLQFKF